MAVFKSGADLQPETGLTRVPERSNGLIEWLAVDSKLAPGWSPQRDGDLRAVLDAWRLADRALAMHRDSAPVNEDLEARAAALRDEYHRLFADATRAPAAVLRARGT